METISGVTKEKNIHFSQKGMNFYEVKKNKSDKSVGIRIQVDSNAKGNWGRKCTQITFDICPILDNCQKHARSPDNDPQIIYSVAAFN